MKLIFHFRNDDEALFFVNYKFISHLYTVATYGQVPVLEVNGKFLSQTQAICRYVARKFKLTGADEWDAARADEIVDGVQEFAECELNFTFGFCWSDFYIVCVFFVHIK